MSETLATIGINGAKFNAAVGWYPEERIVKNDFLVDLSVSFLVKKAFSDDSLEDSIDYMQLHEICNNAFAVETKLIETVAQKIVDQIIAGFAVVEEVSIKIQKLNPPVRAQIESSFVQLNFKR